MINIIVAFPKMENGKSIKSIKKKKGFSVHAVCSTGAQVLQHADLLGDGIVICAGRLPDMMYMQLREYLPRCFQMLVLAPANAWQEETAERVVCLTMPLKVHELLSTVEMMYCAQNQRRKKKSSHPKARSEKEKLTIHKAKEILMARNNMTEQEAHRYIQKCSMESGTSLTETAQMIISMM